MTQCFSFGINATTECFLLAAMAYDCYLAICKPLLYPVIVTKRLCIRLLVLLFLGDFFHSLLHESSLKRLTFYNAKIISHFYCVIIPLLKISWSNPSINFLLIFILSGSIQVFTILTILTSYTFILFSVLKKKSVKGIRKAFSTCGAHLLSVSLYYRTLLFMYVCPASSQEDNQDMLDYLFYSVIILMLNPIIYSLRNNQVLDSLIKTLKRNV
jgi:olfactory receptor